MKAHTQEAGADVKESGLFSGAGYLDDGVLMSQSSSPGKMGDWHLSAGRGLYREEDGDRTKRSRKEVEKYFTYRWTQSILRRQVTVYF